MKSVRNMKVWGLALAVACVFSAVAVANASAASFEASETGTLSGVDLNTQVFTVDGGEVSCDTATTSGSVTELVASHQKVTVNYDDCEAFGFLDVDISPAQYDLYANGEVDILNTIVIDAGVCTVTVKPQSGLKSVSYKNNSGNIIEESNVGGITYTSSNFFCGTSGSAGT